MKQPHLRVLPLGLRAANKYIDRVHRHHDPDTGHRWSSAVVDETGKLRGVAIMGRPKARGFNELEVLEVTRLATDGCPNACSCLYSAACRQQRSHGFRYCITYILKSEPGTSLKAAGWLPIHETDGGSWSRPSRGRKDHHPLEPKVRWECPCSPKHALARARARVAARAT